MTRKMKDSGIEWIGEIPEDWRVMSLKHSLKGLRTGINPRDNFQLGEGNNFYVTIKNFKDGKLFLDEKCDRITDEALEIINKRADLKVNDILFSSISDEGHIFLIKEKPKNWTINESVFSIRPNKKIIHPKFLSYILPKNYIFTELKSKETGSTFKSIKQDHLKDSKIVVPNLNEQRYIVQFLDKKTNQIDGIRNTIIKEIENLENYKKSVITEAVTKGLDKNVEMKDSGIEWIGEIPKHWKTPAAKHHINIFNGSDPKKEGKIPVYGSGDEIFKYSEEFKIGPAVLLGRKGTIENPKFIKGKYWNVDTAFNVECKKTLDLKFYFYLAKIFDYRKYITSTALPSMTKEHYQNMRIPYPNLIEQKNIVDYLDNKMYLIDDSIAIKQKQLETLEEYKKSLIYEYVTGKKEVKDGEES